MSGGKDRKSRVNKEKGWEEAGAEFYQESYPADWDGAMQRDPAAIATLLPSKQTRNATTRRTRSAQQDTKSTRRRQQTATRRRNSSIRRGSQYHEVQVSMLPDLSENLTDEERIWEEIHEIKAMPIPMAQKKEMKAQLQNATKLRLQGFDQIKWQQRKVWQQMETKWKEYLTKLELWRTSLKTIEGNFGTGVVAYFLFLRWIMFLNLVIFLLIFSFIVLPQIILFKTEPPILNSEYCDDVNVTPYPTECCSDKFFNGNQSSSSSSFITTLLDIIQGTGSMEKTLIFYGVYSNQIFGYNNFVDNSTIMNSNSSGIDTTDTIDTVATTTTSTDTIITNLIKSSALYYNLPLAYISVSAIYFLISLGAIIKSASHGFKDRLVEGEGQFYQYCNLIFGGWDFCIHNEKSAYIKHKALYNEITGLLQAKRMEMERNNRSRDIKCKLYAIRFLINIFVVCILIGCGFLIYKLVDISLIHLNLNNNPSMTVNRRTQDQQQQQLQQNLSEYLNLNSYTNNNNNNNNNITYTSAMMMALQTNMNGEQRQEVPPPQPSLNNELESLFYEFLPYIAIVGLNLIVPIGFNYLVQYEKYLPVFVIKITLCRTVLLRLASLAVLLSRIYIDITRNDEGIADDNSNNNNYTGSTTDIITKCSNGGTKLCWETFVGQQFYKLFLTDFVIHFAVTFLINFPRSLIAKYTNNNIIKFLCEQEFELSKHVLDVVYSQTLCWLGSFYAPFLSAIAVVLNFLMFYIKRFQCLINSKPSAILYRASRSNSLFMFILLFAFGLSFATVVLAIAEVIPSRACGPYRDLHSAWDAAVNTFNNFPEFFKNVFFFIGTAGFAIPCLVVLILFLYYYYAVSAANKHMVMVLKNQLVLEGHDKQFLLNRLSSFLKQQQEYQKKLRQAELRQQRERERERLSSSNIIVNNNNNSNVNNSN